MRRRGRLRSQTCDSCEEGSATSAAASVVVEPGPGLEALGIASALGAASVAVDSGLCGTDSLTAGFTLRLATLPGVQWRACSPLWRHFCSSRPRDERFQFRSG